MPDLPELYEALDNHLQGLLDLVGKTVDSYDEGYIVTAAISALCAAIEVKQTQELHDMLNWEDKMQKDYDEAQTTTTETQEEA